jgi:hypothetical protein
MIHLHRQVCMIRHGLQLDQPCPLPGDHLRDDLFSRASTPHRSHDGDISDTTPPEPRTKNAIFTFDRNVTTTTDNIRQTDRQRDRQPASQPATTQYVNTP